MKKTFTLLLLTAISSAMMANRIITVTVSNSLNVARTDVPVVINLSLYGDIRSALVTSNGQEVPCQLDDLNQDETFDELCFLTDMGKKEKKVFTVTLSDMSGAVSSSTPNSSEEAFSFLEMSRLAMITSVLPSMRFI